MNKQQLIKKITQKKEFSQLPKKDVELAFEKFDKEKYLDEEKVKFTRDLLRKVFSGFTSQKLLNLRQKLKLLTASSMRGQSKDKNVEWILKKHLSTRERLPYYEEVYKKILKGMGTQGRTPKHFSKKMFTKGKTVSIVDLGAGVNGFSYDFFEKIGYEVNYMGVEAVGQLVKLTNHYFDTLRGTSNKKINARVIHLSLFELDEMKKIILKQKKPKVVFLFKIIDSLEMLKRDYSKELISEIVGLVDRVVVSFATRSMAKKTKFKVKRNWIVDFIKENFNVLDDFEIGGERYLVFKKSKPPWDFHAFLLWSEKSK